MRLGTEHQTALTEVMRWRRDVRHFRPDPVAEPDLEALRAAMDAAPSVGNARPWRVIRVETMTLRSQVRDCFMRCNQDAAAAYDDAKRAEYQRLKLAGLDRAPVQLAVFTETAPDAGHGLGRQTLPETLEQSTAMAVFALWLTARARNLGVGMVSILDPDAMLRLFDAPETWRFSAYLCVGHPEFADDTPLLHRADWQENAATEWVKR